VPATTDPRAYFTPGEGGAFLPTRLALSYWGEDHLTGPALVGLAAMVLERDGGVDGFQPARLTVDLFRAARSRPTTVRSRLVRDGRRVRSAECEVVQDDRVVARAGLLWFRRSAPPPGELWRARTHFDAPPVDDGGTVRIGSDDAGWSRDSADHQNASRKRFFTNPLQVVAGRPNSPLTRAVIAAEATSLVTNLGTRGIGYINGDLTVGLSRLPVDEWVGVQADSHHAADGVAVGSATLFDSAGPFGTGLVTAVANPAAQIDFTAPRFGPRRT